MIALTAVLFGLDRPSRYIYDEVYHAYTASQYLAGNPDAYSWTGGRPPTGGGQPIYVPNDPGAGQLGAELALDEEVANAEPVEYMWSHPPLGLWLIATGITLWGDTAFGWRFASGLFGAVGVATLYALALSLSRSKVTAVLAAVLLPLGGLYFVQARTGMLDIFLTVFMMAALLALHRFLVSPPDRAQAPLLVTGLFLGLGVATKWSAAYAVPPVLAAVLWRLHALRRDAAGKRRLRWRALADVGRLRPRVLISLLVLPFALYLAAYVPYFATGHGAGDWVVQQQVMLSYHATLQTEHPYQSAWWSWPLLLRPVRYVAAYTNTTITMTYAHGNPLLFWAFVPAVAAACRSLHRKGDGAALAVLGIGFFGQWLPWALVPRSAFLYHFLPSVPFGCVAVAMLAAAGWRRGGVWRLLAAAYVLAVIAMFAFLYPVYASLPLTPDAFERRMWFEGWR